MLVDEAQDLSAERCAMVSEAATSAHVTLAYDEFQCLNPILRPTPIQTWLQGVCRPVLLTKCRRTTMPSYKRRRTQLGMVGHSIRTGAASRSC